MVKPYKKSVHSLSTQRVWISECVYVRVCLPVCVCRVTWGQFRYFCSILLRAKNNCQLSPLSPFCCRLKCVCVSVFACKLQLMIFIFLSAWSSLPRPNHLRIFLLLLCPLSHSLVPSLHYFIALSVWLLSCQIVSLSLPLLLLQFRFFYILHTVMKQRGYHKVAVR